MGREEDKEMTYQLPPQAKQGQFGANVFNAFPVKIVLNSEEQMQKLKLFHPNPTHSSQAQTPPSFLALLPFP